MFKVPLALALLPMFAFAQDAFEVASVRSSTTPRPRGPNPVRYTTQGIEAVVYDLHTLLAEAYQIPVARISVPDARHHKIIDAPYDILAKSEQPVPKAQLQRMLQALLEDRFKLTFRRQIKQQGVYRLVVSKQGAKLPEPVQEAADPSITYYLEGRAIRDVTMTQLCDRLSLMMDRPVLDATGIRGVYSFNLKLDGLPVKKSNAAGNNLSSSSIFTDLPQQIGLQLVADKAPLEFLIVTHVDLPSEN